MQGQTRIEELMIKFLRDELTLRESQELEQLIEKSGSNRLIYNRFNDLDYVDQEMGNYYSSDIEAGWNKVLAKHDFKKKPGARVLSLSRSSIWGAAAAVVIIAAGLFYLTWSKTGTRQDVTDTQKDPASKSAEQPLLLSHVPTDAVPEKHTKITPDGKDIAPGGYYATLRLGDGSWYTLTDTTSGIIAVQPDIKIEVRNGELIYDVTPGQRSAAIAFITLSIPKAGFFKLPLPDGTRVMLNAGSSLRFPVSFDGIDRQVDLTGEAYFDVVHDAAKPFLVNAGATKIQVVGTKFNINAYQDEAAKKATLIQGKIQISQSGFTRLLNEGMQASINSAGIKTIDNKAATKKAMALVEGKFDFENEDVQSIMRTVSRWYDVDVVFDRNVPNITFGGIISRDVTLQNILNMLNLGDKGFLKFSYENKKVLVSIR
jgi:ferric-dicitrate binding protein FerR (iron transport regulator)